MSCRRINELFGSIENKKVETTCVTKETYKCTLTWVIKNFRNYSCKVGEFSESAIFYSDTNKKHCWSLDIFIDGFDQESRDYIGIRAYLYDSVLVSEDFTIKCSILDKDGDKHFNSLAEIKGGEAKFQYFIRKSDLLDRAELLPNDELRIVCEIFELPILGKEVELQPPPTKQTEVFELLFDTKKFSDFKLLVKDKEFLVHRAILGTQSPVFEAMLESDMCERDAGQVEIYDTEPEVMEQLLRFVYVGKIDSEKNLYEKLLVAADKYQLEGLSLRCQDVLVKGLSVANVYETLLLASRCNATILKAKAIEFFDANVKKLVTANAFKSSVDLLPKELLIDIIAVYALKR